MKLMYIIISPRLSNAGAGTMDFRMGKWLVDNNNEVLYVCQSIADNSIYESMKNAGFQIFCWPRSKIVDNLKKHVNNYECFFISHQLPDFMLIEKHKSDLNLFNNILYILHFRQMYYLGVTGGLYSRVINNHYKSIIKRIDKKNSLLFSDNIQLKYIEELYDYKFLDIEEKILSGTMHINDFNYEAIKEKSKLVDFNIITIARADFPFKGYLFGLIDDFVKLKKQFNNISLTIISSGEKFSILKNKVEKAMKENKCEIKLINNVPYSKLKYYYSKAHLNVGLDTTVLDAANHGVPSVVVKGYTYNNISGGYYHENPMNSTANLDEKTFAFKYIKNMIKMDKEEYIEVCKKSHDILRNYYDINKHMIKIMKLSTIKNNDILSKKYIYMYYFYTSLERLKTKIKNSVKTV